MTTELLLSITQAVGPALVGVASAALTVIFAGARRLRRDLASDIELVERLPQSPAERQLRADIFRRTHRLVAASRFKPVGAKTAIFAALSIIGTAGAFLWVQRLMPPKDLEGVEYWLIAFAVVMGVILAIVSSAALVSDGLTVMSRRCAYLRENVSPDEARSLYELGRVPYWLFQIVVALALGLSVLSAWLIDGPAAIPMRWLLTILGLANLVFTFILPIGFTAGHRRWREEGREQKRASSA